METEFFRKTRFLIISVFYFPAGQTRMHVPPHLMPAPTQLSLFIDAKDIFLPSIWKLRLSPKISSGHSSPRHKLPSYTGSGSNCAVVMIEPIRCLAPNFSVNNRLLMPNSPKPAATAACRCENGPNLPGIGPRT